MPSKNHRIKFYADECIPLPSVTFLRTKGINILHVFDKDNIGKSDFYQFNYSKKNQRVFLSLDKDVERFSSSSLENHPGVILIHVATVTPKSINQVLDKGLKNISEEFVKNSLVRISLDTIIREKSGRTTRKLI